MLQRKCNRNSFLQRLRGVYVGALIDGDPILKLDRKSWEILLAQKGNQFHSAIAKTNFNVSYQRETSTVSN